jgi:hypothetical protein
VRGRNVSGGWLEACKRLGWDVIDVRAYGELTEQERAEIELEENIRRKDLTPIELSKEHVRRAATVAPVISSVTEEKDPRGRKRQHAAPKEEIAKALGVGVGTIVRAEQHVEAAETYPELAAADIPQRDAIVMRKTLDELPAGEGVILLDILQHMGLPWVKLAEEEDFRPNMRRKSQHTPPSCPVVTRSHPYSYPECSPVC